MSPAYCPTDVRKACSDGLGVNMLGFVFPDAIDKSVRLVLV